MSHGIFKGKKHTENDNQECAEKDNSKRRKYWLYRKHNIVSKDADPDMVNEALTKGGQLYFATFFDSETGEHGVVDIKKGKVK